VLTPEKIEITEKEVGNGPCVKKLILNIDFYHRFNQRNNCSEIGRLN